MSNILLSDGKNAVQAMPILNIGSTAGAASIDVSSMKVIEFDSPVTVYIGTATTPAFTVAANKAYTVDGIDSLHVDAAVNYIYV